MAKKKTGRPPAGRDDVTVKLDRILAGQAKLVATRRGIPVAQLLSEMLAAPIERAFSQVLKEFESKGEPR